MSRAKHGKGATRARRAKQSMRRKKKGGEKLYLYWPVKSPDPDPHPLPDAGDNRG